MRIGFAFVWFYYLKFWLALSVIKSPQCCKYKSVSQKKCMSEELTYRLINTVNSIHEPYCFNLPGSSQQKTNCITITSVNIISVLAHPLLPRKIHRLKQKKTKHTKYRLWIHLEISVQRDFMRCISKALGKTHCSLWPFTRKFIYNLNSAPTLPTKAYLCNCI